MLQIESCQEIQALARENRRAGRSIALVPTMGFLHAGHLELMRRARQQADLVIVSIFVNPIQFGPNEDLDSYPRDLEGDLRKCREVGVDLVFTPTPEELYPDNAFQTSVEVEKITQGLCGAGRPGHFKGVTTVVSKLFNLTLPDYAFFGEKDYQQLAVIRRMTADLNFPIEIIGVPIIREKDGLAMSSRNAYLSEQERREAPAIHQALSRAAGLFRQGLNDPEKLLREAGDYIRQQISSPCEIEYLKICRADDLEEISGPITGPAVILAAVRLGRTRLIDNLQL
jgi:pantoate--beta-alanine ligase